MQKQQQNLLRQKLKGRDMLLLEKVKTFEVSELSILSYYHIQISESAVLLQILRVDVT